MTFINPKLRKKMEEALVAVMPIVGIVLVLCFSVAPISPSILLSFLLGALLVMVGMMFFTLGAEVSMTPMGEKVGAKMTRSKNIWLIIILSFFQHSDQSGSSVAQAYPTLCYPMDCSTPRFPVHHQLPDTAQTHIH